MIIELTPAEIRAVIAQRKADRIAADLATAELYAPIHATFHTWLEGQGFRRHETPAPGASYSGSSVSLLWECYLSATLKEREKRPNEQ